MKAAFIIFVLIAAHSAFAELPAAFKDESRTTPLFNAFQTEGQRDLSETEDAFLARIQNLKTSLDEGSLRRLLVKLAERRCGGESLETIMKSAPIFEPDALFLKTFLESIPIQFINGRICGKIQKQGGSPSFFRARSSVLSFNLQTSGPQMEERTYAVEFLLTGADWFDNGVWNPSQKTVSLGKLVMTASYPRDERERVLLGMGHQINNDLALVPFKRRWFPSESPRDEFPLWQTVQRLAKTERIPALQRLADRGDLEAIHLIGYFFEIGHGTNANPRKAFEFYERAAKEHYRPSLLKVGMAYLSGVGTDRSEEKAKKAFQEAISLGSVPALSKLGYLLSKSASTKELGKEYLVAAGDRGDSEALINLAEIALEEGKGKDEILDLLEMPIVSRYARAAYTAGKLLAQGKGADRPEALRFLILACMWSKPEKSETSKKAGELLVKLRSEMTPDEKYTAFENLAKSLPRPQ